MCKTVGTNGPPRGRPGGNTLIARMNRGSLAAVQALFNSIQLKVEPQNLHDTRIPLHSCPEAIHPPGFQQAHSPASFTSFSMSNLLQEKGVYLHVHGGVSSAQPEQGRQQVRFTAEVLLKPSSAGQVFVGYSNSQLSVKVRFCCI